MLNKPIKQINPMPLFVYFFRNFWSKSHKNSHTKNYPRFDWNPATSKSLFDEHFIKEIHERGKLIRLELIVTGDVRTNLTIDFRTSPLKHLFSGLSHKNLKRFIGLFKWQINDTHCITYYVVLNGCGSESIFHTNRWKSSMFAIHHS